MYLVYSLMLTAGLLVLSPYFLYQAWRHGKYLPSIRERLGLIPQRETTRPAIWLHCVSVGETQAARPLAQALRQEFPEHDLVVSTTTLTGQSVAREAFTGIATQVFYFPFDWRFAVRRALDRVNPGVVLIMETELWPNFLRECGKRSIPVGMVNGRLSARSFGRYRRLRGFMLRVLENVQLAAMQTKADVERITGLGLASERALVTGNVKFDLADTPVDGALTGELRERFRLDGSRPVIVAASTHDPEEEVCLAAFRLVTEGGIRARLIIAPRHPERFEDVAELFGRSRFSMARRSKPAAESDRESDLILLDSIGELRSIFALADLVFVGGSVAPTGGHNVLEPAAFGKCIVTGSHTFNFDEIMRTFIAAEALVQMPALPYADAGRELGRVVGELLRDDVRRDGFAQRAFAVVNANRGATRHTIEAIRGLITTAR
jgi:3-deoxy-D-manno-octulosonic-acid transferase